MFIKDEGFGSEPIFEGHSLVLPSLSTGSSPILGTDLFLVNQGYKRAGFFYSKYISPIVGADILALENPNHGVSLSCEGKVKE
jgi:hypothetical protein